MSNYRISIVQDNKGYRMRQMPLNLQKIQAKASHVCENHNARETCIMLITKTARDEMFSHICWGNHRTYVNRVEQGGLLAGVHYENPKTKVHYCVVLHAYPLTHAHGSPTFLDARAANWAECFAAMDRENAATGLGMNTIGWFHTHPNGLSTFMSGTDRHTQSTVFNGETNFALVLNPHSGSWKAFRGPDVADSCCYMLDTDDLSTLCGEAEPTPQQPDMDALKEMIRALVTEAVAAQRPDMDALKETIRTLVAEEVARQLAQAAAIPAAGNANPPAKPSNPPAKPSGNQPGKLTGKPSSKKHKKKKNKRRG